MKKALHILKWLILAPFVFLGLWVWAVWSWFKIRKNPELAERR